MLAALLFCALVSVSVPLASVSADSICKLACCAGRATHASGFLDGDNSPNHLPGHTLFDLSFGKNFGEDWLVAIQSVNVANRRFLLDNSNTFGGTHFVEPRQVYVEVKYRFHY